MTKSSAAHALKSTIRPPAPGPAKTTPDPLIKIAHSVLDDSARRILSKAAHTPKPEVDFVYSLGKNGARGQVSTRVRFSSGREVMLAGRLGLKDARKRAIAIVEAEFTARLLAAVTASSNWLAPLATGGGAQRPIVEAYRLLRAALESAP